MKKLLTLVLIIQWLLLGCSAIKSSVSDQYKISDFSQKKLSSKSSGLSLLITQPEAVAGYQTNQMLYIKTPFEVAPFAHTAWVSAPADMLFPLILQSVQSAGYFYAVASSPYSDKTDFRLDTQLIELQQNFLTKPSKIHFVVKSTLTRVSDNHVIASEIFTKRIPCPEESPYGGVLAANQAVKLFTSELSAFVVNRVKQSTLHPDN